MITKSIKERIKEYFFLNPLKKLRIRHIEKEVKVPLPSAIRYVKELENEGILKKDSIAGITLYSSDRTSQAFLLEKRLANIKRLYDSGLVDYLRKEYSNPTVILFGSYFKGEDVEKSDIDLYIETPIKETIALKEFEKKLGKDIEVFKHRKISEISNKGLINNILNGLVLNGFIEVFKNEGKHMGRMRLQS